jgi:hypothetical protein
MASPDAFRMRSIPRSSTSRARISVSSAPNWSAAPACTVLLEGKPVVSCLLRGGRAARVANPRTPPERALAPRRRGCGRELVLFLAAGL